jgi:hypothetical protein
MAHQCSPTGISKLRDIFESALTAAGLHVAQGSKIWEAYRQYEHAVLLTIDESDAQVEYLSSLYHESISLVFVINILYNIGFFSHVQICTC